MSQVLSIFTLLATLLSLISAQSTSIVTSSTSSTAAAASASASLAVYPGEGQFKYLGCYTETTLVNGSSGARALEGGTHSFTSLDDLTPQKCFSLCGSYAFAGFEYGKECWCAAYLNSLSNKTTESDCNIACVGNSSSACGGSLRLSLYSKSGTTSALTTSQSAGGSSTGGAAGLSKSVLNGCLGGLVLVGGAFVAFL